MQSRTLTHEEVDALAVRVNDFEEPLESAVDYSARFRKTLPHFPHEIISQWFYEHRQAIYQNSWLPLSRFRFRLEEFSLAAVSQSAFSENPIIAQYRVHFENENTSRRMGRIAEFILNHGTWPCAPIALANPEGTFASPWGMRCDSPYHLLEGHHRFAVLLARTNANGVAPCHKIWVAQCVD